jgi:hypothetical protein
MSIILPIIHLNGSAPGTLLTDNMKALGALREAVEELQRAAPHGRDYYPLGDNAIRRALEGHAERLKALETIIADIELLCIHISDHIPTAKESHRARTP